MTFWEKVKLLIERRYTSESLKRHKDEYFCNKWWCFKVQITTLNLSEIKSNLKSIDLSNPVHKKIELDILEKGFDYSKGHIYLTSKKRIFDGYHRYFILKKHFDGSLLITVYVLTEVRNSLLYVIEMSFVHLFVNIYRYFFKRNKGQIIELNL